MFLFWPLLQKTQDYLSQDQIGFLAEAFLFSADAHETQTRSSGEPYINHPVAVACLLADLHMDVDVLAATLMHDVVEDTSVSLMDIEEIFGAKVAHLVDGVTKLKNLTHLNTASAQADSFRKMILASASDVRVILMKLADRLHNVQTLTALRPDKRRRIAKETMEIYVPIANRLGMHSFKNQLEEFAFEGLYPLRYRVLKKSVETAVGHRKRIVEKILDLLRQHLISQGIDPENIQGRQKRLYGIFRKMRYKDLSLSEIMDVYAFRVIAKDIPDCYRILGLVHSVFKPVPGRFKDYIAIPKANGYQSLHTTLFGPHGVPIEIQIRTQDMHDVAENGIAAHWLYKDQQGKTHDTEIRTREWLEKLLDMQERSGNSIEFMEHMKIDLFPDEVYVFTPRGDIMELPLGATALDFAYAVHTNIGNQTQAIKVNRKEVPFNHLLKSGDQVEVIRDPTLQPTPSWLNCVVTGKAKSAIRFHLKLQEDDKSVALGKKLLQYALSELGLQEETSQTQALLATLQLPSERQLYYAIGIGEYTGAQIAMKLKAIAETPRPLTHPAPPLKETHPAMEPPYLAPHEPTQQSLFSNPMESTLLIKSSHGSGFHFCSHCWPLPGDAVQGILVKGQALEVHLPSCTHLHAVLAREPLAQMLPVRFSEVTEGVWPCAISLMAVNRAGVLAKIATLLSDLQVNIQDMSFEEMERTHAKMRLVLEVHHRHHLAQVLRRLRKISDIMKVQLLRHDQKL